MSPTGTDTLFGILLVAIAGLGTGTCVWPMKLIKRLQFENYWFIGMLTGLIVIPWVVVFIAVGSVSEVFRAYGQVGMKTLLLANLCAVGWGIANIMYGLCVVRIGAALTGSIVSGLGIVTGVTLPMIVKGSGLFHGAPDLLSNTGLVVMCGVAVMIAGVVLTSIAGFGREKTRQAGVAMPGGNSGQSGRFAVGLTMAVLAGVVSAGIALSFVYSQGPIVAVMEARGLGPIQSGFAVWAAALFGGALVNVLYPAFLMTKRKSWGLLLSNGRECVLAAVIGAQLIVAVALFLGTGMLCLGALGASVGFGVQQGMQVLGSQAVGFFSGEWRGVRVKPLIQMIAAVVVLLFAVVVLACANRAS